MEMFLIYIILYYIIIGLEQKAKFYVTFGRTSDSEKSNFLEE